MPTFEDLPIGTIFLWENSPTNIVKVKLTEDCYGRVNEKRVFNVVDTERNMPVVIRGILLLS